MLSKLLAGVAVSSIFCIGAGAGHVEAKPKAAHASTKQSNDDMHQVISDDMYNAFNINDLKTFQSIFEEQAKKWKNFDSLPKEKMRDEYDRLFKEYSKETSSIVIEFYNKLKERKYISEISSNIPNDNSQKNPTRKSVSSFLFGLTNSIDAQLKFLLNMINKEESSVKKDIAKLKKMKKISIDLMDNKNSLSQAMQASIDKIQNSSAFRKGYDKILAQLLAGCKLLRIDSQQLNAFAHENKTMKNGTASNVTTNEPSTLDLKAPKKKVRVNQLSQATEVPTPPPAPSSAGTTAGALIPPPPPPLNIDSAAPLSRENSHVSLTDQLASGVKLKKTTPNSAKAKSSGNEIESMLKKAMDDRRKDLEPDPEEEQPEDDWKD